MKKIFFFFFVSISCTNNEKQRESVPLGTSTPKADCAISITKTRMRTLPAYYMFAFQTKSGVCGFEDMTPENINRVISQGGAFINDAFCCKTSNGFRMFTTCHTFLGCSANQKLKLENYDVVSLPFPEANSGFEITQPKEGECVTIKGFKVGDQVDWVEVTGTLQLGTLKDVEDKHGQAINWNPGKVWLIKTNDKSLLQDFKGLSGSPVLTKEGKVCCVFSGFFHVRDGKYLPDGNYLRVEELIKTNSLSEK